VRYVAGGTLFLVAILFQFKLIYVFRQMIHEVNGALPAGTAVPTFGPSWIRGGVIRLHRQFFPGSGLRKTLYRVWGLEMAAFISALACVVRFA
jgi:hypothetical protein